VSLREWIGNFLLYSKRTRIEMETDELRREKKDEDEKREEEEWIKIRTTCQICNKHDPGYVKSFNDIFYIGFPWMNFYSGYHVHPNCIVDIVDNPAGYSYRQLEIAADIADQIPLIKLRKLKKEVS